MMIDVVLDLSHWQSPVNFAAVEASGVLAVILKATQGASWVDFTFIERSSAARAAGLLVGAYHFADASDPCAQVGNFLGIAGSMPRLAIDIEANGMGDTVSIAQAAELVARLQMATGKLPLVYMGRWGPTGDGAGLPNSVLTRCPLWLPEYGPNPVPPDGWDMWTLWQYTSSGDCPGVGGICDRSQFSGTADDLAAWWAT
jgi:lysozyme